MSSRRREDILLQTLAIRDHDVIMDRGNALSILGDHFRQILCVLRRCRSAQPHHSILVGVDADPGESLQMLFGQFCFYLRRDGRVFDIVTRTRPICVLGIGNSGHRTGSTERHTCREN